MTLISKVFLQVHDSFVESLIHRKNAKYLHAMKILKRLGSLVSEYLSYFKTRFIVHYFMGAAHV